MKLRYLFVCIVLCIVFAGCSGNNSSRTQKDDYKAIETLNNEMKKYPLLQLFLRQVTMVPGIFLNWVLCTRRMTLSLNS